MNGNRNNLILEITLLYDNDRLILAMNRNHFIIYFIFENKTTYATYSRANIFDY